MLSDAVVTDALIADAYPITRVAVPEQMLADVSS